MSIDLRSDAVTQPNEEMWEAMRSTSLGWAAAGEDPSVLQLETTAAHITGKEAAVFTPTGTMANLAALMAHTRPGDQILAEASCHILWSEEWSYASICGLTARALQGNRGSMDPDDVRAAIRDRRFNHQPHTALVCIENTHNMAGGTVLDVRQIEAVASAAHNEGIPVHLDGARLPNAAVALGVSLKELAAPVDSLMICLNKGLSAPGGAVLCGSTEFVGRARTSLKRIGGHAVKASGILAAAGVIALERMMGRLAEDHRRARALAEELANIPGITIDPDTVQTNIVMVRIDAGGMTAETLAQRLTERDVQPYIYSDDTLRLVTHRHIGDEDVCRTVDVMRCLMS